MTVRSAFNLNAYLEDCRQRCQGFLALQIDALPPLPSPLRDAMQYACLSNGKLLRPALVYASARASGASAQPDGFAAAVELIHCYSLIHDDLPAMDDDELRRGRPTVHRAFDEATAILTGDALQALAFELLADETCVHNDATKLQQSLRLLSRAAGYPGMVGGQSVDIAHADQPMNIEQLEQMHRLKTGALIRASVELGSLAAGTDHAERTPSLGRYADCIGLAFQVQDDILDVIGETDVLGKTGGADAARNKPTYVSLLGLEQARSKAQQLTQEALDCLAGFGPEADALRAMAVHITRREH